jgi:hypothetical protein
MRRILLAGVLCAALAAVAVTQVPVQGQQREVPGFHHLHLNVLDPDVEIAYYTTHFPSTSRGESVGLPALRSGKVSLLFTKVSAPPKTQEPQSAYWHFGWQATDSRKSYDRYKTTGTAFVPNYTDDGEVVPFSGDWVGSLLTKAQIQERQAKGAKPPAGGYGMLRGPSGEIIEWSGNFPVERFYHVHMFQEKVFCAEVWYQKHFNAALSGRSGREGRTVTESDCDAPPTGEPTWLSTFPEGTRRTPLGGVKFDDVEMNWYQRQGRGRLVSSKGYVMDHVGLSVKNLDAWYTKLRDGGVKILDRPYTLGTTRAFMVEGPSLERIELVEIK